jgi:ABC-2 type transport system ATP-binding protein
MADRVGVINKGEIILVEEKQALMRKLGKKEITLELAQPINAIPDSLAHHKLELSGNGHELTYSYDTQGERTGITSLLQDLAQTGIRFRDLNTKQSSLEDIFVDLVRERS